jgi:hypothetical protein
MGGHCGKEAGVIMMWWAGTRKLTRMFELTGVPWHGTKSPSETKGGDAEGATTVKDPSFRERMRVSRGRKRSSIINQRFNALINVLSSGHMTL